MSLVHIRIDVHKKFLKARNLSQAVKSRAFEELWSISSPQQQALARRFIEENNHVKLLQWIENHPIEQLGDMSFRDLRLLGQEYHVPYYSRLSHGELIKALKETDYAKRDSAITP